MLFFSPALTRSPRKRNGHFVAGLRSPDIRGRIRSIAIVRRTRTYFSIRNIQKKINAVRGNRQYIGVSPVMVLGPPYGYYDKIVFRPIRMTEQNTSGDFVRDSALRRRFFNYFSGKRLPRAHFCAESRYGNRLLWKSGILQASPCEVPGSDSNRKPAFLRGRRWRQCKDMR